MLIIARSRVPAGRSSGSGVPTSIRIHRSSQNVFVSSALSDKPNVRSILTQLQKPAPSRLTIPNVQGQVSTRLDLRSVIQSQIAEADEDTLLADARCFECIPDGMQDAVQAYLLCQILGSVSCDANALIQSALCFDCIPAGSHPGIQTGILCNWANGGDFCNHPTMLDWLARIDADFVPRPSDETIQAVCATMWLRANGSIWRQIRAMLKRDDCSRICNCFSPQTS